jgi:hypothetical protein
MFANRPSDAIVLIQQLSVIIGDIGEELRAQGVSECAGVRRSTSSTAKPGVFQGIGRLVTSATKPKRIV